MKRLAFPVRGSPVQGLRPLGGITGRDDRRCIWEVDTASVPMQRRSRKAARNEGEQRVKLAPRAVIAALITTTAVAAALLSSSVPALASPTPPAPNPVLFGTWANTNPGTNNVVDIVVSPSGNGIMVDGFGACSPTPCQWGNIPGTVFGANVSSPTGNSFEANWNFGFSRTVLLATVHSVLFVPVLTVQEFTTFTDHSGRSNFEVTETFVRSGSPISPTRNGTAATNYPLGASVSPASNLLGIWVNTSPAGGNIRRIIISLNPNGTLRVRAFGNCVPTLCPWGKVTGITFGTSISSLAGQVFLAPYRLSFANKLVDGTVNVTGTQLTVHTYTEFTDGSGRSNYVSTDTFSRI
jgi:hypothetical protein